MSKLQRKYKTIVKKSTRFTHLMFHRLVNNPKSKIKMFKDRTLLQSTRTKQELSIKQ